MRKLLTITGCCLLLLCACQTTETKQPPVSNESKAEDEAAIRKAVDEAYHAISFNKGEQPRFDSMRNFAIPEIHFIDFRNDTLETLNMDQFINVYRQFIHDAGVQLFYEVELKGRTDQFGRVAQRMSTYATYLNTKDSATQRGVNSFQLIKTSNGWKVSSIIWDVESPKLKIPAWYLPADAAKPE